MRTLKSDHQPNRNIGDDILDQYRGIKPLTAAELDIWVDRMERQQREIEAQGSAFVAFVAPDQQTIYSDYMPAWATRVGPTRLDQIMRRLAERGSQLRLVDPRAAMQASGSCRLRSVCSAIATPRHA